MSLLHQHRAGYFAKCDAAIQAWKTAGPKALNSGGWDIKGKPLENAPTYTSGIYLFVDRQNISHYFPPNFEPPYDTLEKRKIILDVLSEEWDEKTLSWISVDGNGPVQKDDNKEGIGVLGMFCAL